MSTPIYTHNEAIFIRLLQANGQYVALPDLMDYTKRFCKSACFPVHSRINDIRQKYGYDVYNKQVDIDGVKHSSYMIELPDRHLQQLRKLWNQPGRRGIPHANQIIASLSARQTSMAGMFTN